MHQDYIPGLDGGPGFLEGLIQILHPDVFSGLLMGEVQRYAPGVAEFQRDLFGGKGPLAEVDQGINMGGAMIADKDGTGGIEAVHKALSLDAGRFLVGVPGVDEGFGQSRINGLTGFNPLA